jgi:hypothetical protein
MEFAAFMGLNDSGGLPIALGFCPHPQSCIFL